MILIQTSWTVYCNFHCFGVINKVMIYGFRNLKSLFSLLSLFFCCLLVKPLLRRLDVLNMIAFLIDLT